MLKSARKARALGSALALAGFLTACPIIDDIFPPSVPVYIGGDFARPVFDPDTVVVNPGNTIEWTNQTNASVTLQFFDAPLDRREIVIAPGGTGRVRVNDPAEDGVYKYNALFRLERETNLVDPYIDIEPPPGD